MKYDFDLETPVDETVELAFRLVKVRRQLADALSGRSRTMREYASQVFADIAKMEPYQKGKSPNEHTVYPQESLVEFEATIIDALERPEAMTRYNCLACLRSLLVLDARCVDRAFDAVEDCLYDERSGQVRYEAFKLLANYGSTTAFRSEKVWALLKDGVQCYHGDPEFIAMLNELILMLEGKASDDVKQDAGDQFLFDADNGRGILKKKAQSIVDLAPVYPEYPVKEEPVVAVDEEDEVVEEVDEDEANEVITKAEVIDTNAGEISDNNGMLVDKEAAEADDEIGKTTGDENSELVASEDDEVVGVVPIEASTEKTTDISSDVEVLETNDSVNSDREKS